MMIKITLLLMIALFSVRSFSAQPAVINSVDVLHNGEIVEERYFNMGDTVTIRVNASDPGALPLEYVFRRYRSNMLDVTLVSWSTGNELTYTFVTGDLLSGFSIVAGVKNNDGIDVAGFYGDAQRGLAFFPPFVPEPEKQ